MNRDPELNAFIDRQLEQFRSRPPQRAFEREEYDARAHQLREAMVATGLDLLLVSSPEAMCWLHGYRARWYKGHSPTVWPPTQCTAIHAEHDRLIHFDMESHRDIIAEFSIVEDVRTSLEQDLTATDALRGGLEFILGELRAEGWLGRPTGIEKWSWVPNPAVSAAFEYALTEAGCTVSDATMIVRRARRVKSPAEIATIEEAARVCDAGNRALQAALKPGMTELEGWVALMAGLVEAGGEPAAIHECVLVGPIDVSHAISSRRKMKQGDYVFADPCGVVNRYHANVARQFVIGEPDPEAVRLAEIESAAYDILAAVAKAGTPVRQVNRALREHYMDAGVWGRHAWTGGYELGLSFPPDWVGEWLFTVDDEAPEGVIEAGVVTNYESMMHFGMIDTIVYEEDGARVLGKTPREILVAGA